MHISSSVHATSLAEEPIRKIQLTLQAVPISRNFNIMGLNINLISDIRISQNCGSFVLQHL